MITRGHDDREATITFTPDLDEQKRLMDIYAVSLKKTCFSFYYYYVCFFYTYVSGQAKIDHPDGKIIIFEINTFNVWIF